MKICFFGLGSIGSRHLHLIRKMYPEFQVSAYRTWRGCSQPNWGDCEGLEVVGSWLGVDQIKPDIAFITNPTALHINTAIECAERGMALFIEKPAGHNTDHLDTLLEIVKRKNLTTYVAYTLRHSPIVAELKNHLEGKTVTHARYICSSNLATWRPDTDCAKSYSANAHMGGGVLLDLSHGVDLMEYLFGPVKEIRGAYARRGNVTVDAEDVAKLVLIHESGVLSSVDLNVVSRMTERSLDVDTIESPYWYPTDLRAKTEEDPYEIQLRYFFDNLDNPRMMNNLHDASVLFRQLITFKENKG